MNIRASRPLLGLALLLGALLPGALAGPAPAWCAPADDEVPAPPLLERIAVVGASVSHGFGLRLEVSAPVTLSDVLGYTLRFDGAELVQCSTPMFFEDARRHGMETAARARAAEPTLVVAIDYLFWYGYGYTRGEEARLRQLELGLAELERFECPLVVADFPDIRPALDGDFIGGMAAVQPAQIPSTAELAALSARVHAWAAERGNVMVVPLAEFLAKLHAGEPFELRGNAWEGGGRRSMLQKDLLHPTLDGTISLALLVGDTVERARDDVPATAFEWDAKAVRARLWEATDGARQKQLERERRREERRRKREERKRDGDGSGDGAAGGLELLPGGGAAR